MKPGSRVLRISAGVAVLALLAAAAALLLPVYYRSFEFGRALNAIAREAETDGWPDEAVRAAVLDRAGRLPAPLDSAALRLDRTDGRLRIDVRYRAPVRVFIYTVDLHFHSRAGR